MKPLLSKMIFSESRALTQNSHWNSQFRNNWITIKLPLFLFSLFFAYFNRNCNQLRAFKLQSVFPKYKHNQNNIMINGLGQLVSPYHQNILLFLAWEGLLLALRCWESGRVCAGPGQFQTCFNMKRLEGDLEHLEPAVWVLYKEWGGRFGTLPL